MKMCAFLWLAVLSLSPLNAMQCPPGGVLIDEMEASAKSNPAEEDPYYGCDCPCRETEYYNSDCPNEVSVPTRYEGCYDGDYDESWYYENSIERTWPSKIDDSWRDELTR